MNRRTYAVHCVNRLVAAPLGHIAGTQLGTRRYLNMGLLKEIKKEVSAKHEVFESKVQKNIDTTQGWLCQVNIILLQLGPFFSKYQLSQFD